MVNLRDVVAVYLENANRGDAGAQASLFAPGGRILHHKIGTLVGAAIRRHYEATFADDGPTLELSSLIVEGNVAVAEVLGIMPPSTDVHLVIDHFTFDEAGLIERLAIYHGGVRVAGRAAS